MWDCHEAHYVSYIILEVVQAKTQGCKLGTKTGVHDEGKLKHIAETATTTQTYERSSH